MKKVLIAYFPASSDETRSNEGRVAVELEKVFGDKGFSVSRFIITPRAAVSIKDQFKQEKELLLLKKVPDLALFDLVIIGTPVVGSLTSAPIVNKLVRDLPKNLSKGRTSFALFSVGVIPGFAIKKVTSLLSMKGIKPIESQAFTSLFEFDSKKLSEVKQFAEKTIQTMSAQNE